MKFSISTSFYRRSHLVEKLYQQILNQTHTDWEWIVTDDFSDYNNAKDLLLEICSKDPRVKYYEQSRKKECFYNPQRGSTGDIVIQFDSDDYAYPRILEIYNHLFLKHPEVAGISCLSLNADVNDNFIEIQGGGHYDFEETSTFNYTPMGRAWRNIIDSFDNGELKWYQNDTNIVRHVETKGKWLYIPRTLYKYLYSVDTFSRETGRTGEQYAEIEAERLFIESKFPYLNNPDKLTSSLYYLPIKSQARDFAMGEFNLAKTRQSILYIKKDIKVYERQLLKELFFDHDLYFENDLNIKYDEIIVHLNLETFKHLDSIIDELKNNNTGTHIKFKSDKRGVVSDSSIRGVLDLKFIGGYGWCHSGYETYFITAL
jgi:glycosyltransferase involved in cell wall biosynthesis